MFGEPVFHNIRVIAPCDLTESQSVVCILFKVLSGLD